jgi:HPt (histidine-containing phosphotransfer) domain-containing protein
MPDISPDKDIDLSFLYDIADGSDEFIIESVGMFLEQAPDLLHCIQTAMDASDWPATALVAHKIKANLGFFGMLNSQALIQEIEILSKSGAPDPAVIREKFNEVKIIMEDNLVILAEVKAEKEANL